MVNLDPSERKSKSVYVGKETGDPLPGMRVLVYILLSALCVMSTCLLIILVAYG